MIAAAPSTKLTSQKQSSRKGYKFTGYFSTTILKKYTKLNKCIWELKKRAPISI